MGRQIAVFGMAVVADGLLLAGGSTAVAVFGFLVFSVIATDTAMSVIAVGNPIAPIVAQRRGSKGGLIPVLRAFAADRTGFVVSSLALAGLR